MDLAKLERATFQLNNEYFNLIDVVTEVFQMMNFKAQTNNIKFLITFDTNKPFIYQNILGDKRRYMQILTNFISNSLKFTNSGFIKIHLITLGEQICEYKSDID